MSCCQCQRNIVGSFHYLQKIQNYTKSSGIKEHTEMIWIIFSFWYGALTVEIISLVTRVCLDDFIMDLDILTKIQKFCGT